MYVAHQKKVVDPTLFSVPLPSVIVNMFYSYVTVSILETGLHALFEAAIDMLMLRLLAVKNTTELCHHQYVLKEEVGELNGLWGQKKNPFERWKIMGRHKSCTDTTSKSTRQLKSMSWIHPCRNKLSFAVVHSGDRKITFQSHGLNFDFNKNWNCEQFAR